MHKYIKVLKIEKLNRDLVRFLITGSIRYEKGNMLCLEQCEQAKNVFSKKKKNYIKNND